jgi:hypothetical protein
MKEYLDGVKKRAGLMILFGQMCIIMYQLSVLDQRAVVVCEQRYHQLVCVEQ